MKRIVLSILILSAISMSSCYRKYECECISPDGDIEYMGEFVSRKQDAQLFCNDMGEIYVYQGYDCTSF